MTALWQSPQSPPVPPPGMGWCRAGEASPPVTARVPMPTPPPNSARGARELQYVHGARGRWCSFNKSGRASYKLNLCIDLFELTPNILPFCSMFGRFPVTGAVAMRMSPERVMVQPHAPHAVHSPYAPMPQVPHLPLAAHTPHAPPSSAPRTPHGPHGPPMQGPYPTLTKTVVRCRASDPGASEKAAWQKMRIPIIQVCTHWPACRPDNDPIPTLRCPPCAHGQHTRGSCGIGAISVAQGPSAWSKCLSVCEITPPALNVSMLAFFSSLQYCYADPDSDQFGLNCVSIESSDIRCCVG